MIDDKNIPLPVMEILRSAYLSVINRIKPFFIFSYLLAATIYLVSNILPAPPATLEQTDYIYLFSYVLVSLIILISVNVFFYRLYALDKDLLLKINLHQLLTIFGRMAIYLVFLLFLLFIALLAVLLLFGLANVILTEVAGENAANEAVFEVLVQFSMLVVGILINMRLQPTFISISLNRSLLPLKSAFYYTRDNSKELIIIGLFSYIPAMLPMTAAFMFVSSIETDLNDSNSLILLFFPLLLLPNILILSAGAEIYKFLVPAGPDDKNHIMDITT